MKRVLKAIGGFVAVVTLSCLLAAPAQARVFVNVGVGFPVYYGYCGPAYYPGYYYSPYAYRPAYRYYYPRPAYYYSGGAFYYYR
jgi:hypothetical protein